MNNLVIFFGCKGTAFWLFFLTQYYLNIVLFLQAARLFHSVRTIANLCDIEIGF